MADQKSLPDCGLYKTGIPLPSDPEHLPEGQLVYFHNHSEDGKPIVCCPDDNTQNRWSFQKECHLVDDLDFIDALIPLAPQGLYVLKANVKLSDAELLPERTLVQLGYDRQAMAILFPGRFDDNGIHFPKSGLGFDQLDIFDQLEPVNFLVPDERVHLH